MNCDSIPRAWHSASFIKDKNLLVIFGGERTVDGCPECLDDIMVLDTGAMALLVLVLSLCFCCCCCWGGGGGCCCWHCCVVVVVVVLMTLSLMSVARIMNDRDRHR